MIKKEPNWKSYIVETTTPIFTPEQCNIISKIGRSLPAQTAAVGGGEKGNIDTKTRISHISWIPFNNPEAVPMYKALEETMWMTNKRHFGFENMELNEYAQYTEYPEGGFYNWHMDLDTNMSKEPPVRKISMTLILSAEDEFEGGGLEIQKPGNIIKPKQGHAVFFASFINHRVIPVTRGVRKSLVVWFGGEPFK
jgi:PKHD-type hydroxylase|tara:strand:- start:1086 stop:1670 length:585 start_codon:yes stop_codon:yes gene_type:complete